FSSVLSQTPLRPICSSSCLPSCDHFCTIPSALPPIQILSCPSTKQAWIDFGINFGSPQAFTRLPSESYSITLGAGCLPTVCSIVVRSERFTPNTLSSLSTQTPPTAPVTQRFGKGFGQ